MLLFGGRVFLFGGGVLLGGSVRGVKRWLKMEGGGVKILAVHLQWHSGAFVMIA